MRYILISLLIIAFYSCTAQSDPVLYSYLATHKYIIKVNGDSSTSFPDDRIPQLLAKKMAGKRMFVNGEGFSHALHLNSYLRRMFMGYFVPRGLKYYFQESARSWVVEDALYLNDELPPKITGNSFTTQYYKLEKELYETGKYQYMAIDFERPDGFNNTLKLLLRLVDSDKLQKLYTLAPYMRDTAGLLHKKNFVKFLEEQRDNFYKDSNSYKVLMGKAYSYYCYMISDPLPSAYGDNRNRNMATHILQQTGTPQPGDFYLLDIGMAHTMKRDGIAKTTVAILNESETFKDKMLITHLYCDGCHALNSYGDGDNNAFKFMKGAVLASFQKAANSDIVLFDLTELPEQYEDIRNFNDLLVFAKGQR